MRFYSDEKWQTRTLYSGVLSPDRYEYEQGT